MSTLLDSKDLTLLWCYFSGYKRMFNNSISFLLLTNYSVDNGNGWKEIPPFLEGKVEVGVMCWCKGQWSRLLDSYGLSNNCYPTTSSQTGYLQQFFSGYFRIFLLQTMTLTGCPSIAIHPPAQERLYIQISVLSFSHNNASFPKPEKPKCRMEWYK